MMESTDMTGWRKYDGITHVGGNKAQETHNYINTNTQRDTTQGGIEQTEPN